ncbi:MAG TPA: adenylyltransferase/cytidyltransferase family protein [Patescibacteria group bacterium]
MENNLNILKIKDVENVTNSLKSQNKRIVLTGGCFDILHFGHITLLENAKSRGDILFVMLESDDAIRIKKGINRPIHTQIQRAKMLSSISSVDYIIMLPSLMSDTDYDLLVKKIKPDIIATTKNDKYAFHKKRQAKETGAKLIFVNDPIKNISTTSILQILSKEI